MPSNALLMSLLKIQYLMSLLHFGSSLKYQNWEGKYPKFFRSVFKIFRKCLSYIKYEAGLKSFLFEKTTL